MKDTAIIVVDELYDFIDGSLACKGSAECVANSAEFLKKNADSPILFVRDSHPADHCSFAEQGGPWPPHCVRGTRGAEIAAELLPFAQEGLCFYKGTDPLSEQYSGFEGRNEAGQTLDEVLQLLDIKDVVIIGIATEFCVRNTAEDFLKAGYGVSLKEDCLAYVDAEGHKKALSEMRAEGIRIL